MGLLHHLSAGLDQVGPPPVAPKKIQQMSHLFAHITFSNTLGHLCISSTQLLDQSRRTHTQLLKIRLGRIQNHGRYDLQCPNPNPQLEQHCQIFIALVHQRLLQRLIPLNHAHLQFRPLLHLSQLGLPQKHRRNLLPKSKSPAVGHHLLIIVPKLLRIGRLHAKITLPH